MGKDELLAGLKAMRPDWHPGDDFHKAIDALDLPEFNYHPFSDYLLREAYIGRLENNLQPNPKYCYCEKCKPGVREARINDQKHLTKQP